MDLRMLLARRSLLDLVEDLVAVVVDLREYSYLTALEETITRRKIYTQVAELTVVLAIQMAPLFTSIRVEEELRRRENKFGSWWESQSGRRSLMIARLWCRFGRRVSR